MFRLSPVMAGGLLTGLAAAVAAVLTVATATPTTNEFNGAAVTTNRAIKTDQLPTGAIGAQRLQTILFDANPFAFAGEMNKPSIPGIAREVVIEQATSDQAASDQAASDRVRTPRHMPVSDCETGLSPDLSPTVPQAPGLCIVQNRRTIDVASIG